MDPYSALLSYTMQEKMLTKIKNKKPFPNATNQKNEFIMVVGLDRTGTSSLRIALSQLGYKMYHFNHAYSNKEHMRVWSHLLRRKLDKLEALGEQGSSSTSFNDWTVRSMIRAQSEWSSLFSGFDGCCGSPSTAFFLEIKAHFHGRCRVILCINDNSIEWHKSMVATWHRYLRLLSSWLLRVSPVFNAKYRFLRDLHLVLFKGKGSQDEEFLCARYGEWKRFVRRSVYPESKLLVYKCRDGWAPLCKFLGKKTPPKSVKFPHRNRRAEFETLLQSARYSQKVAINTFIALAIVIAVLIRVLYLIR